MKKSNNHYIILVTVAIVVMHQDQLLMIAIAMPLVRVEPLQRSVEVLLMNQCMGQEGIFLYTTTTKNAELNWLDNKILNVDPKFLWMDHGVTGQNGVPVKLTAPSQGTEPAQIQLLCLVEQTAIDIILIFRIYHVMEMIAAQVKNILNILAHNS